MSPSVVDTPERATFWLAMGCHCVDMPIAIVSAAQMPNFFIFDVKSWYCTSSWSHIIQITLEVQHNNQKYTYTHKNRVIHVNNSSNNGRRTSLLRTGVSEELLSMYHTISCKSYDIMQVMWATNYIMSRVIIFRLPCSSTSVAPRLKSCNVQRTKRETLSSCREGEKWLPGSLYNLSHTWLAWYRMICMISSTITPRWPQYEVGTFYDHCYNYCSHV